MTLDAWVDRVIATIAEERRNMRRRSFDADTATLHQGRRIEAARVAWYAGYQRYEPQEEAPNGD